jgi:hypothetical protein
VVCRSVVMVKCVIVTAHTWIVLCVSRPKATLTVRLENVQYMRKSIE